MQDEQTRLEEIFGQAVMHVTPAARSDFLTQACGDDTALRQRLDVLLGAHDVAGAAFLNLPHLSSPLSEGPGTQIGQYKLLEQIGEGGFGVVFMAEQEHPIRRMVALKIVKLGMDTRQIVARFETERQALAMMDHPNIAKVFDAGSTDTGRPFFVMELVKGIPITQYCDERKLNTRERLALFISVCNAVQHAHQKGIIHRDLKPSNVLVTIHDDKAVPKVIDFGVAKATEGKLTEETLFTEFRQLIGTPTYMSPEQAQLSGLDVDTRSDVYALGVLLYELLTGTTPFDTKQLLSAAYDEMQRIIREVEPPPPSTRLATLAPDAFTLTADKRQCDPKRLGQMIRGELDWIVMRCLEKDRTRRYESASSLATEVQRYLVGDPVQACPPSTRYWVSKFIKRHRIAISTATAIASILVIALIVSASLAVRAHRAEQSAIRDRDNAEMSRQEAVVERQQAEEISKYLISALGSPVLWREGRTITIAEVLDRDVKELHDRFNENPTTKAGILMAIGDAYMGLGLYREAVPLFEEAVELRKTTLGLDNRDTLESMHRLAWGYDRAGRATEALQLGLQTFELRKKLLGPNDLDTLRTMRDLASHYWNLGRTAEMIAMFEETLQRFKAVKGGKDRETIQVMNNLAAAYRAAGQLDKSVPLQEESLRLTIAEFGQDNLETFVPRSELADTYRDAKRTKEAVNLGEYTVRLMKAKLGEDHPDTLWAAHGLALDYKSDGRIDDARKLMEQTLKLIRVKLGSDHPSTIWLIGDLADIYLDVGRKDDAFALGQEVINVPIEKIAPGAFGPMSGIAYMFQRGGRLQESAFLNERTLNLRKAVLGPAHPETLMSMAATAYNYRDLGRLDDAIALLEQTIKLQTADPRLANISTFDKTSNLLANLGAMKKQQLNQNRGAQTPMTTSAPASQP